MDENLRCATSPIGGNAATRASKTESLNRRGLDVF